jgi:hypothetical protein
MADVIPVAEIAIDGVTYSMLAKPAADSKIVAKQKGIVLKNLKLDKLVTDLMRSGELLWVAFNGVAGFGGFRASVWEIGDKLGKLASDCESTMQRFEKSAGTILENLKDTFKFMLMGEEDWAINWLNKAGIRAGGMADEAEGLAQRFDSLANDAVQLIVKAETQKGLTEVEQKKLEAEMANIANEQKLAEQRVKDILDTKTELEGLLAQARAKAETAENRAFALSVIGAIMKPLGDGLGAFGAAMLKSQSPMSNLPPISISPSGGADRPPGGGADRPPGVGRQGATS